MKSNQERYPDGIRSPALPSLSRALLLADPELKSDYFCIREGNFANMYNKHHHISTLPPGPKQTL